MGVVVAEGASVVVVAADVVFEVVVVVGLDVVVVVEDLLVVDFVVVVVVVVVGGTGVPTVILIETSSEELSEYVTTILVCIIPAVFVLGFVLNRKVVPLGSLELLLIPFTAEGSSLTLTEISRPTGLYFHAMLFSARCT